jgi:hypothetical protein
MIKVVWSQFLPIRTYTLILHRTLVIRIFVNQKVFKLIYLSLKLLKTPVLFRFCFI